MWYSMPGSIIKHTVMHDVKGWRLSFPATNAIMHSERKSHA
jgi:hypothetical protein